MSIVLYWVLTKSDVINTLYFFILFILKEIGEMTVTVENATWRGKPCYLVHANSHGSVDQVPIGTSVTGTV